jgi:hypothetical protein
MSMTQIALYIYIDNGKSSVKTKQDVYWEIGSMSDTDSIVCSYKDDDKSTVKAGCLLGDWTGELTG